MLRVFGKSLLRHTRQKNDYRLVQSAGSLATNGGLGVRGFSTQVQGPSFLSGDNNIYAEEMYRQWKQDPKSVHPSWDTYFRTDSFSSPLNLSQTGAPVSYEGGTTAANDFNINIVHLIRAYQARGHLMGKLDPLGLLEGEPVPELQPESYGFTEADMPRQVDISGYEGIRGLLGENQVTTLGDLIANLKHIYCGTIGVEYMHIASRDKCNFIRDRFEIKNAATSRLSQEEKLQVLERLAFATLTEKFCAKKWNTAKRFGLEGCESFIPGFKSLIDRSTELGVKNVVIGMPHRGRLNVLANVVRKDMSVIFREFEGTQINTEKFYNDITESYAQSGDVKYHLGASLDRSYPDGRTVHLSLAANPSHLEAVDPVVIGKARAKQHYDVDRTGERTMPVLIHGDAAFCGQGVVYETMHMAQLDDYKTGGCVHVIVNNQIGYTTDPKNSRSTRYCTDLGKAFDCPIWHVNADDPLGVAYVFKMAAEYRQKFGTDVIIDITGYRQMGHNEMDQPMFTQPEMYKVIQKMDNVYTKFQRYMVEEGYCTQEHADDVTKYVEGVFEEQYALSKTGDLPAEAWNESPRWENHKAFAQTAKVRETRVDEETLKRLGKSANTIPEGFTPHRTLKKMLETRLQRIESGKELDWALGEQLAWASLLEEGTHVRISGQDVQRGTFAHRHAVLHDQRTYEQFTGLNHLSDKQAEFQACNSSLSEFGIMGFELGYSLEDPNALIMWEAQFGDFVNGAQIMIDQFLTAGEAKWKRQCGLVLLLPHGYDGQGPEHSSSRVERFLQSSDEDPDVVPKNIGTPESRQIQDNNWQVVNCTTPAQIFHALRRQVHRDFRKPLIVITPKAILRTCTSDIEEFSGEGAKFQPLIPEVCPDVNATPDADIRKLIFCSGKVYYELEKARKEQGKNDIAIARIEQITPFPFDLVAEQVKRYPNAELVFTQEEPKNMGTWYFCDDRIYTAIRHYMDQERRCTYVGRGTMASPAVGFMSVHSMEQKAIIDKSLQ